MDNRAKPDISAALAGALDWWRDAGVDCAFVDEPVRWISQLEQAEPEEGQETPAATRKPPAAKAAPASSPAPAIDRADLPADLPGFAAWWLNEPALADGPTGARIAPRGAAGAELMIVVPEPEREDREQLLSGPQGRLIDAMLAAMGLDENTVYLASALPRTMPGADWEELAAKGMGQVLSHHIALVKPKRLALFGANILALIGNGPPQGPADLRIFNHEGSSTPMLASRSLAALLEQPRWKARIWQAWLDWTG